MGNVLSSRRREHLIPDQVLDAQAFTRQREEC
jgi:hypothetical protein